MAGALDLATSDFLMPYARLIDARSDAEAVTSLQEATHDLGFDQLLFGCDITPGDLAQAGIAVVKAALVRHASMAATSTETNEVAA